MKRKFDCDEKLMELVKQALSVPVEQREAYLESACRGDAHLLAEATEYVQWEDRMKGFLTAPIRGVPIPSTKTDRPFEPGQLLINRFRIVREVAEGGMGIVWEAQDEKLNRRVAIKCAKTAFHAQLPPEVRTATQVSHPNVCKIHEIHTVQLASGDALDFISMEFLPGATLAKRLKRGAISRTEARSIALQLCAGLAEAHRNHVIHGDLKTNNIILTEGPDGEVRAVITDFGLARRPDASGFFADSAPHGGTPNYMAPELWQGKPISVLSDIYALGVVFRQLFSQPAISLDISNNPTLPIEEIRVRVQPKQRRAWRLVIKRCLDANPARRFSNAEEVAKALNPWWLSRSVWIFAVLFVLSGIPIGAYFKRVTSAEEIRLSILPFGGTGPTQAIANRMRSDLTNVLSRYNGKSHGRLAIVRDPARATYTLRAAVTGERGHVSIHATVVSGLNTTEWDQEYEAAEIRFAALALAGLVTETLHLPPIVSKPTVNARARRDYEQGLIALGSHMTTDSALSFMQKAVLADSDSPLTHAGLAEAEWVKYYDTKDEPWLGKAVESAARAERRNPDLGEVHRIYGKLAERQDFDQAVGEYKRAIEIDPGVDTSYRRLGQAYEGKNLTKDAIDMFQKAIAVGPRNSKNYWELGAVLAANGDYRGARYQLQRAVKLAPEEMSLHFALAQVDIPAGLYSDAEHQLRTSLGIRETPELLQTTGLVLMYRHEEKQAIRFLIRAKDAKPSWCLPWLDLLLCYRQLGEKAHAGWATRQGLRAGEVEMAESPRNGYVHSCVAFMSVSSGDAGRASAELAEAMHFSPTDAETLTMVAMTYEALNQRADALRTLTASSTESLEDVNRWPYLPRLRQSVEFQNLLHFRHLQ